jgi:superfamily II RNA helicase
VSDPLPLAPEPARRSLADFLPPAPTSDAGEIFDRFLGWVAARGLTLYPAQEQALLELLAGKHVVLDTPTGSGKSLVALGLHFKAVCEGAVSFYTSPIKALASEKFFALCDDFGADRVGMLTGDASINAAALVRCCTAEVLSNMALRRGEALDAPYVVMDEFHYYADRDRGVAWQVPLITLPGTQFLLMSATLGDVSGIAQRLRDFTGREVAVVSSSERPVPLDFTYRETPIHETIQELLTDGKAPIYVVNFTQRECAELAQALTSLPLSSREQRDRIKEAMRGARLDTPYGREFRRFLSFGVGVHHAGLLPKYRLLVEQLAQQGLLTVISGTDTLGVGVNIPIRTVLFTKLAKFDGRKVSMLAVRDFKQIAGRAGRKGFDEQGSVVAQAPEHVIERKRAVARGGKKPGASKGPAEGEVSWTKETFERLISRPPETLQSKFKLTHGMLLDLIHRDAELDDPSRRNFAAVRELIARSHADEGTRTRLLRLAAQLVRSLHRAGILRLRRDVATDYFWVVVADDLQLDFSLHHALSLFLVEALALVDRSAEDEALQVLTVVESILEDPEVILRRQQERERTRRYQELKAEGVPYEELKAQLDEVRHPQPMADFLHGAFAGFRRLHPWIGDRDVQPKAIGREMVEGFYGFSEYVKHLGLQRSEGVLLRYLSQLYKALVQSVPEPAKSEALYELIGFFRTILERTDTSLLEEWESLLLPELRRERAAAHDLAEAKWLRELASDPRLLAARVRTELHLLVKALAARDWEAAVGLVAAGDGAATEGGGGWDERRLEEAMAPFFAEYGTLVATAEARRHRYTQLRQVGERRFEVTQTLLDPAGDELWAIHGVVDLALAKEVEAPLVAVERIGP